MKQIITKAAAAMILCSTAATAHDVALDGDIEIPSGAGYVSSDGSAVRTGGGECLRLGSWSEDTQVNACEGIEATAEKQPEAEADQTAAPAPPKKEPIVTTATLGGEALFASNSAALTAASEQALADLLVQLESFQEITEMRVIGHTDATGDADYNQGLSEQRAQAVEGFLKAAYPSVNISSVGLGEESPVATNSTPEGRQLNRRVEIEVKAKSISQ